RVRNPNILHEGDSHVQFTGSLAGEPGGPCDGAVTRRPASGAERRGQPGRGDLRRRVRESRGAASAKGGSEMGRRGNCPRGHPRGVKARQTDFGVLGTACDEYIVVDRWDPSGEGRGPQDVRPWTPWQLVGASVVFGPAACGAVAGLNFARLGKRQYLIPSIVVGAVLFLVVAWL